MNIEHHTLQKQWILSILQFQILLLYSSLLCLQTDKCQYHIQPPWTSDRTYLYLPSQQYNTAILIPRFDVSLLNFVGVPLRLTSTIFSNISPSGSPGWRRWMQWSSKECWIHTKSSISITWFASWSRFGETVAPSRQLSLICKNLAKLCWSEVPLAHHSRLHGLKSSATAETLIGLAGALHFQGEYDIAKGLFGDALEPAKDSHKSSEHLRNLWSLCLFGPLTCSKGTGRKQRENLLYPMWAIEKFVEKGYLSLVVPRPHLYGPLDLSSAVEKASFRTAIDNLERILGIGHAQMLKGVILLGRCLIF